MGRGGWGPPRRGILAACFEQGDQQHERGNAPEEIHAPPFVRASRTWVEPLRGRCRSLRERPPVGAAAVAKCHAPATLGLLGRCWRGAPGARPSGRIGSAIASPAKARARDGEHHAVEQSQTNEPGHPPHTRRLLGIPEAATLFSRDKRRQCVIKATNSVRAQLQILSVRNYRHGARRFRSKDREPNVLVTNGIAVRPWTRRRPARLA
jgi:hypothetical protein